MYESVLRALGSNQRSHRSPRHAVARALTHQASPASIRAPGFSPLTGGRPASRHGTLSEYRCCLAGLRHFRHGSELRWL